MKILIIPQLSDNYSYIIYDEKEAIVIDPTTAGPVMEFISQNNLTLRYILNTHHHHDHTAGNKELRENTGAKIICSSYDIERIGGDIALKEGNHKILNLDMQIIDTPGHTAGHIAYHFPTLNSVFTGDALFSAGCGRLFEGSAHEMAQSLAKLTSLEKGTLVFCGHEYTEQNCKFALQVEPGNEFLQFYSAIIKQTRKENKPTVPSTICIELDINPFMRLNSPAIKKYLNKIAATETEVFTELRTRKDLF